MKPVLVLPQIYHQQPPERGVEHRTAPHLRYGNGISQEWEMLAGVVVQHELHLVQLHQLPHAAVTHGQIIQELQCFADDLLAPAPVFQICYTEKKKKQTRWH